MSVQCNDKSKTIPDSCGNDNLCSECFEQYTHGCPSTWSAGAPGMQTVTCLNDERGVPMPYCAGLTRADGFGQYCRSACQSSLGSATCKAQSQTYCNKYPGNLDCRCQQPSGTSYGEQGNDVHYNNLVSFVNENTISAPPRCLYGACSSNLMNMVFPPPQTRQCPKTSVYCAVSDTTVTIQNVQAQNIDIIQQNCGASTAGGGGGSSSNSGTDPVSAQAGVLTRRQRVAVVVSASVFGALVLLGLLLYVWRSSSARLLRTNLALAKRLRGSHERHKKPKK